MQAGIKYKNFSTISSILCQLGPKNRDLGREYYYKKKMTTNFFFFLLFDESIPAPAHSPQPGRVMSISLGLSRSSISSFSCLNSSMTSSEANASLIVILCFSMCSSSSTRISDPCNMDTINKIFLALRAPMQ